MWLWRTVCSNVLHVIVRNKKRIVCSVWIYISGAQRTTEVDFTPALDVLYAQRLEIGDFAARFDHKCFLDKWDLVIRTALEQGTPYSVVASCRDGLPDTARTLLPPSELNKLRQTSPSRTSPTKSTPSDPADVPKSLSDMLADFSVTTEEKRPHVVSSSTFMVLASKIETEIKRRTTIVPTLKDAGADMVKAENGLDVIYKSGDGKLYVKGLTRELCLNFGGRVTTNMMAGSMKVATFAGVAFYVDPCGLNNLAKDFWRSIDIKSATVTIRQLAVQIPFCSAFQFSVSALLRVPGASFDQCAKWFSRLLDPRLVSSSSSSVQFKNLFPVPVKFQFQFQLQFQFRFRFQLQCQFPVPVPVSSSRTGFQFQFSSSSSSSFSSSSGLVSSSSASF